MAKAKVIKTEPEGQSELLEALQHVSDEKGIPVEALVGSIEGALVSAYKKAFGGSGTVRVVADFEKNDFRVFAQKLVVQRALNPNTEISWRTARETSPGINLGEAVEQEVTPQGFGRIAAQTAKQVLLQKLREAERKQVVSEYSDRLGEMFRGVVQRIERGNVILSIGKAEAILPRREQIQDEHYRFGDSIYVFVLDVRQSMRGPSITVSRTHPGLVRQLFELEVPEITDGIVELKSVAREAGQRTKIAVAASNPDVDPVGACVGPRGMRVGKVVAELGNEKVDIVRWNADPILYITNALSPAQISKVLLMQDQAEPSPSDEHSGTATVIVTEDQQSLAIGRQGQNVRLAAKLTGWRIDIRTDKQYAEEQAKKMFAVDDAPVATPTVTRESADALANIFPTSADEAETAEAETADAGATVEASVGAEAAATENAPEAVADEAAPDDDAPDDDAPAGADADVAAMLDDGAGDAAVQADAGEEVGVATEAPQQ